MATFTQGHLAKVYTNGYDLTSYFKTASPTATAETAETTTFGKTTKTFKATLKDGTFSAEGLTDISADAIDQVLNTALGVDDSEITYYPEGDAIGKRGVGMQAIETSASRESPVDGINAITMEAQSSVGAEPVFSLQPLATNITADGTAASTVDNTTFTEADASAYLHVTTHGGGTIVAKVQDSEDDSAYVDLITFAAVTSANQSERATVAGSVSRYTRATWTYNGAGTVNANVSVSRIPGNV